MALDYIGILRALKSLDLRILNVGLHDSLRARIDPSGEIFGPIPVRRTVAATPAPSGGKGLMTSVSMKDSINLQPLDYIISKRKPGNTYEQRVANRAEFESKFVELCRTNIVEVDMEQLGWTPKFKEIAEKDGLDKTPQLYHEYMFAPVAMETDEYLDFYRKLISKQIEILPGTDFKDNGVFMIPGLEDRVFKIIQPNGPLGGIYYRTIHEWYYSMLAFNIGITCKPISISVYKLKGSNVIHVIGCWEKVYALSTTSSDWSVDSKFEDISWNFHPIELKMMEYDFIHGDCHYGNFAIKDEKFILIDWGCGREKEEKKDGAPDYTWIDDKGNQRDYDPAKYEELKIKPQGHNSSDLVISESSKNPYHFI